MRRNFVVTGLSAAVLALAVAFTTPASAQQYYGGGMMGGGMMGPGMMGPGMMGGQGYWCPNCGMMGPGMMGPGMMGNGMMGPGMMGSGMMGSGMMGPGMMGWGYGQPQANLNLSTNDVKAYLDRWVTMMGNPHVKVGPVTEKDTNTITADIVTTDKDALVQRFSVDRHSGFYRPVQ